MSMTSIIGQKSIDFIFEVTAERIKEFAQAIGDDNPLYSDEEHAKKMGYPTIIAPLTFPVVVAAANEKGFDLGLDQRRMLHGEQEFIYMRPIHVGDILSCHSIVSDVYEKKGKNGVMEFIVIDTNMLDVVGELVVTSRMNIVYRALQKQR
ncbi:MaoC family dehydratase N-terminal domain-containing protein [Kurthia sibirica]|uniref:MaoC family dehydratase n=1 Tax=Kurthia sibirica TaxID=202750 RepID=A0A2U3ALK8_9BACL|nr:MaoC family dehydratase N-terminal domain-containing protein [Kurthia sibirica]PWI25382.1 MaoC family dehydratase [Kurthia sibirica]GEK34601.1 hypothetical protein KSI01_21340 [Kurthia sibirica]